MAKFYLVIGHGGSDPGAIGYGRAEKDDVLRLGLDVGRALVSLGHTVRYNRTADVDTDMWGYIRDCNDFGADFCLSMHRNSFNESAKGYETCIYANEGKTKIFADAMNVGMEKLGFKNRGSKIRQDLAVLNSTTMYAALGEYGFISNAGDNRLFDTKYSDIVKLTVDSLLKAVGASGSAVIPEVSKPVPGRDKDLGKVDLIYQAFTDKWWPPVKNYEDWAGKGDGVPIRYLGFSVSKGSIIAQAHTLENGWLPPITFKDKYDINDLENGVIGDGSPIDVVKLYYVTPDGYIYQEAVYCVSSIEGEEFYPVQIDDKVSDTMDGYAGVIGKAMDKFKAWIQ